MGVCLSLADMTHTVRVNFSRPMALFPLPATVLLPHAVQPLHIFESRYRQMVDDCLDQAGQFALACFSGHDWKDDYEGLPTLRPAVCVGQIVQHEKLAGGRHNILVHGVCRAEIKELVEPEAERLYRTAHLNPLEAVDQNPPPMLNVRKCLRHILDQPRLRRMRSVESVLEWFDREDVPTHALLELIGFTLVHDPELKYCLLAEADAYRRARLLRNELLAIDRVVMLADHQGHQDWPKGMSWN